MSSLNKSALGSNSGGNAHGSGVTSSGVKQKQETESSGVAMLLDLFDNPTANNSIQYNHFAASMSQLDSIDTLDGIHSDSTNIWIEFLDGVSLLQAIDLTKYCYNKDDMVALLLNLYHLMIFHGFLIYGNPTSVFHWKFFSVCSYEAFGDIFSLAELEHCIIRFGMARPSINIVAQSYIPQSRYAFSLDVKDFRLLWAVNCGSESMFGAIPIYKAKLLNAQLEANMVYVETKICFFYHRS